MKPQVKIVLWTSSIGFAALLARRLLRRRKHRIDVGFVSEEWLARQRGLPPDPFAA
jgi:hypothetical protein